MKLFNDRIAIVRAPSWGLSVERGDYYYGRTFIWHIGPWLICT